MLETTALRYPLKLALPIVVVVVVVVVVGMLDGLGYLTVEDAQRVKVG